MALFFNICYFIESIYLIFPAFDLQARGHLPLVGSKITNTKVLLNPRLYKLLNPFQQEIFLWPKNVAALR